VGRHDAIDAGGDAGAEGDQFDAVEPLAVHVEPGHAGVRIYSRVAVAGKVFEGDEDGVGGVASGAFDVGLDMLGYKLGVLAVGADVDDRILRIVVDIGIGGVDPVDAERPCFAGGGSSEFAGELRAAGGGEGHRVGVLDGPGDPHGGAALKVAADQQRDAGELLHPVDKRDDLEGLGVDGAGAGHPVVDDDAADAIGLHGLEEGAVGTGAGGWQHAGALDDYQLGGPLAGREGGQPALRGAG
jgi:hypothetical protein